MKLLLALYIAVVTLPLLGAMRVSVAAVVEVTSTTDVADAPDLSSITALNNSAGPDGQVSLREAILAANNTPNNGTVDEIRFAIPGSLVDGFHTIRVSALGLPAIADTVVINGATQLGFAGIPLVRLDGDSTSGAIDGVVMAGNSGGSTIRSLAIVRFSGDGGHIQSGVNGVTVAGCWIGSDGTGSAAMGNGDDGVEVIGADATIGGLGAFDGNVINHSIDDGINLTGSGTTILGNHIGLEADGTSGGGNGDVGIAILAGASGTTIGGVTLSARNVISMNYEGIEVNTSNNVIAGNFIGTDAGGTLDRGNHSDDGVEIKAGSNNTIGGTANGSGNLIAFNQHRGVNVLSGSGNSIRGNRVHSNDSLGIDLASNGVTFNDPGDGDGGPNNSQNFPLLTTVVTNEIDTVIVEGSLNGIATTTLVVEFFVSAAADDTGYGEGERVLGSTIATTNNSGNASFTAGFTGALAVGAVVSATATDPNGNTSEFSLSVSASLPTRLVVTTASNTVDGDTLSVAALLGDPGPDGEISLFEALVATNRTANGAFPDEVHFDIAGPGPHTLLLNGALPPISDPVIIDGTSEPDFLTAPVVVLDGSLAGAGVDGLDIAAGGCTVRGLAIVRFDQNGIRLRGVGGNTIAGCYLGTDASLLLDRGNGASGIVILSGSDGNTIGGVGATAGNRILGNQGSGVSIE